VVEAHVGLVVIGASWNRDHALHLAVRALDAVKSRRLVVDLEQVRSLACDDEHVFRRLHVDVLGHDARQVHLHHEVVLFVCVCVCVF